MKRLLAVLLAVCFVATMFTACGEGSGNNSSGGDTEVVNIADYAGIWKISQGEVDTVKIDAENSTVTAYAENGIEIATFAAVATADGLVLKMGALGNITLEDPASLTVTALPQNAAPSIAGDWTIIWGNFPDGTALHVKEDGTFTNTGAYEDSGTYTTEGSEYYFSSTHELVGLVTHVVTGGGAILQATNPSSSHRVYVRDDSTNTDTGKAIYNYYYLSANSWSSPEDSALTVEFKENGKMFVSGMETGIWYPTADGATVEYTDQTTENLSVVDGTISISYIGKSVSKE